MSIHTILYNTWLFVALVLAFLDTLGIVGSFTSISIILLHLFLAFRKISPAVFQNKSIVVDIANILFRYSILIFIFNVFVFTWSFAFGLFFLSLVAKLLYIELPKAQERIKEQNEFKQQFGDLKGDINQDTITKKHIQNLFEKEITIEQIDQKVLKKQFRNMAKKYHPDANKGEHNDRFHSIKLSYDYLKEKIAK